MLTNIVGDPRCLVFDVWHGIRTRGNAELDSLTIDSPNLAYGVFNHPTHPKLIRRILHGLVIDYSRYTFLDYGSGKGRVLLVAAGYPFKRIVGVEFAKELHNIAVRNIQCFRGRRLCNRIESVHADALAFGVLMDPLVIFLHNSLRPLVLTPLMEEISLSLLAFSRDVWLV